MFSLFSFFQVCSCCLTCTSWLDVPGAQLFAACAAGEGPNSVVRSTSKLSHQKIGVKTGKQVRYTAQVKNTGKSAAVNGLSLAVELPAGVVVVKPKTTGNFAVLASKGNKTRYHRHVPLQALVDTATVPATVTWHGLLVPPGKRIKFVLVVRVNANVPASTRLTFGTSLYQQVPVNGLPYCASAGANQSVVVASSSKGWSH